MPPTSRFVSERKFGQKNAFVRVWSEGLGQQSFWFGIYVLWLTSFPMSGALLPPEMRITWFALPHALALLALGRWLAPHALQRLLPLAAIGTPVTEGITLKPIVAGAWRWSDDRTLLFVPEKDWPVDAHYTLDLAKKKLLADGVLLS